MDWRTRRKLNYTFIALIPLLIIAGVVYYSVFFPAPTCNDGVQNGTETGVDCGGQCEQICQSNTTAANVAWSQSFPVSDEIYNAAARIENPNMTLEAKQVPYSFRLYDQDGLLIAERQGEMYIPPQPTTVAFEPGIVVGNRAVARTEFQFITDPFWEESSLTGTRFPISNKTLSGATSSNPRLTFDVTNESVQDYTNVHLSAIVSNGINEPVHVSQTDIGELPAQSSQSGVFTWRQPFPTRTVSCMIPSNTMLLLDRSGSMNEQQESPPQPFTAVKRAATDFVSLLGDSARSGLVAFATNANVAQPLTEQHNRTRRAINEMYIRPEDETGFTNMGAAVQEAQRILGGTDGPRPNDVMIILTDGKANAPQQPGGEVYARQQITQAKQSDTTIYTIGLGSEVNQQFLSEIASTPEHYFQAGDRQSLSSIYQEIHERLCEQAPFITEIIPTHYRVEQ